MYNLNDDNSRLKHLRTLTSSSDDFQIKDSGGTTRWRITLDSSNNLLFKYYNGTAEWTKIVMKIDGNMEFYKA
jgi:hypothetical protein